MRRGARRQSQDRRQRTKPKKNMPEPVEALPASSPSTHSEDGVDLTLIRWMLSLSPAERLQVLQANLRAILRLRRENT